MFIVKASKPIVIYKHSEPIAETSDSKETVSSKSKPQAKGKRHKSKQNTVVATSKRKTVMTVSSTSESDVESSDDEPQQFDNESAGGARKKRKRTHRRVKKSRRAMRNESVSRRQRDRDSFLELSCALDEADTNATMIQLLHHANKEKLKYKYHCLGTR